MMMMMSRSLKIEVFLFLVFGEWKAKWVEVKLTPYDTWKYVYNIASFN